MKLPKRQPKWLAEVVRYIVRCEARGTHDAKELVRRVNDESCARHWERYYQQNADPPQERAPAKPKPAPAPEPCPSSDSEPETDAASSAGGPDSEISDNASYSQGGPPGGSDGDTGDSDTEGVHTMASAFVEWLATRSPDDVDRMCARAGVSPESGYGAAVTAAAIEPSGDGVPPMIASLVVQGALARANQLSATFRDDARAVGIADDHSIARTFHELHGLTREVVTTLAPSRSCASDPSATGAERPANNVGTGSEARSTRAATREPFGRVRVRHLHTGDDSAGPSDDDE